MFAPSRLQHSSELLSPSAASPPPAVDLVPPRFWNCLQTRAVGNRSEATPRSVVESARWVATPTPTRDGTLPGCSTSSAPVTYYKSLAHRAVLLEDLTLGCVTILFGRGRGRYPDANALLITGSDETLLIDATLGVVARGRSALSRIDRVLLSHCHEDHTAANFLLTDLPCYIHAADLPGLRNIDSMLNIYGFPEPDRSQLQGVLLNQFYFAPRTDLLPLNGGEILQLGGGVSIHVLHSPGHTRGHCCFLVEPPGLLYLADVDLTGFGPYYGDAWSSLIEFENTFALLRQVHVPYYLTAHHIGLLEGYPSFLSKLAQYASRISDRERRLPEFLHHPRSLDDVVAERFIYRPQDETRFINSIERRSMSQHLERLQESGIVQEADARRFVAT